MVRIEVRDARLGARRVCHHVMPETVLEFRLAFWTENYSSLQVVSEVCRIAIDYSNARGCII
jgi:hypothetical protein